MATAYAYDVNATDPDEDTLTYSLTVNPTGMTIVSTTGVIGWTPTSTQLGNHSVTVEVSDGALSATQSFIIIVSKAAIIYPPHPTPPAVVVPVSAITVTGTGDAITITADNGTLQMLAAVLPTNATNSNVTWSVTNGTGSATISTTGLLTAVTNGTVTVKATANDGSGKYGEKEITITNNGAVIGVNADTTRLSANAYDNPTEGLVGGYADYLDTFLSVNEQPASLEIWAYAGDPATPGVEKLQLTGNFNDITAIDYSMSYRDSSDNPDNAGGDWMIYNDAQLNTFFTALVTAVDPKVVITVTDLAGNVTTQTIDLVVPAVAAIAVAAIAGVTRPVYGATPVTTATETAEYTAAVTWAPATGTSFGVSTFTATITLTPKTGYTLTGVAANFFTVDGARTVTNSANSGVVTAVFPTTYN